MEGRKGAQCGPMKHTTRKDMKKLETEIQREGFYGFAAVKFEAYLLNLANGDVARALHILANPAIIDGQKRW
jgi:hypothetical protein